MKEVSVFYSKPRGVFISAALLGMLILPSCNLPTDAVVMEESMDAGFESSNEVFDRCDFNGDGTVDSKESRICEQQQGIDNAEKIDVQEPELIPAGGTLITYVNSAGVGNIAVRLELPEKPRYPEGAPVVVHASTFFAQSVGFHRRFDTFRVGAISIAYLRPGRDDPLSGAQSDGEPDHGGPDSLAALRDVIRFASGVIPNHEGFYIDELLEITPLTDNVGMFASSHSGIVATNVLAYHGEELTTLKYLVGRENPTRDEMYPLELGYFDDRRNPIYNPHYHPEDYTPTTLHIDYSTASWLQNAEYPRGRIYFMGADGNPDHFLHEEICPEMWGKRYYSRALTQALFDNGALRLGDWPDDLATPEETHAAWPFRTTVDNYPSIGVSLPELRVILVFAELDHVQAAPDKPHIHQAYDGFRKGAGLWVRMNPDRAYVQTLDEKYGAEFPDNPANTEPVDWQEAPKWGFPGVTPTTKYEVPLAAVAEMADRVRANDWSPDLNEVLNNFTLLGLPASSTTTSARN